MTPDRSVFRYYLKIKLNKRICMALPFESYASWGYAVLIYQSLLTENALPAGVSKKLLKSCAFDSSANAKCIIIFHGLCLVVSLAHPELCVRSCCSISVVTPMYISLAALIDLIKYTKYMVGWFSVEGLICLRAWRYGVTSAAAEAPEERRRMVCLTGLEPVASQLGIARSIHLSYRHPTTRCVLRPVLHSS